VFQRVARKGWSFKTSELKTLSGKRSRDLYVLPSLAFNPTTSSILTLACPHLPLAKQFGRSLRYLLGMQELQGHSQRTGARPDTPRTPNPRRRNPTHQSRDRLAALAVHMRERVFALPSVDGESSLGRSPSRDRASSKKASLPEAWTSLCAPNAPRP